MFGHWIEISVIMEKEMVFFDAKRADDDIYGFAHRNSAFA